MGSVELVWLNEDGLGLGTSLGRGFWGSGLSVKGAGAVSLLVGDKKENPGRIDVSPSIGIRL